MKINGIILAVLELSIFYKISYFIRNTFRCLYDFNLIFYYWLVFTILTGIWEYTYVKSKKIVKKLSKNLIMNHEHVWTNTFSLKYLLPWNFSNIFYSEYAAYADREYMYMQDDWSRVIEGSHAICCGLFSLIGIILKIISKNEILNIIFISIAMGCQLMNSILYISQYLIQIKLFNSVNYNTKKFPCGKLLIKRPFMYINILWTIMPIYVIYSLINSNYNTSVNTLFQDIVNFYNINTIKFKLFKLFKLLY